MTSAPANDADDSRIESVTACAKAGKRIRIRCRRVMLGTEQDALEMPRIRIDWRYSDADCQTVLGSVSTIAAALERSGVGRFDFDPDRVLADVLRHGAYGGHHIGTARMGTGPDNSAVDSNCRVHGMRNLFIASSAVFPTSGQATPTLTIVALALRLGEHLLGSATSSS